MNTVIWIIAGGLLGWGGYAIAKANEQRGVMVSIAIGAVGGFLGGMVLAPVFGAITSPANDFSMYSLVIAAATATACLTVSNMVSTYFGV